MALEFSAVGFDLDGTLYPNYRLNIRLLPFLCGHWRLVAALGKARKMIRQEQELDPSAVLSDFHIHQAQIVAKLLHARPEQIKEEIDRLVYQGWERHFCKVKMLPHVREVLDDLRAAGLKLGLLSDFPALAKLKNMGLDNCWDAVLCSEDTGAIKPAIQPFKKLSEALKCPPEQILYVGNSRHYDVAGARRAGMKAALRTRVHKGYQLANFTFHDYRQLRDFVLN
jgi:putative hydrolase of the HAD superfamily